MNLESYFSRTVRENCDSKNIEFDNSKKYHFLGIVKIDTLKSRAGHWPVRDCIFLRFLRIRQNLVALRTRGRQTGETQRTQERAHIIRLLS